MARAQFSITVSPKVGVFVEERARELGLKKSAVIEEALEVAQRVYHEDLMREGYQEMAKHDAELNQEFAAAGL